MTEGDFQIEELRRGTPVWMRWGQQWYRGRVRETAYDIRDISIYVPRVPRWAASWQMSNDLHVRLDDKWYRLFSQGGRMTLRTLTSSDRQPEEGESAPPIPEGHLSRLANLLLNEAAGNIDDLWATVIEIDTEVARGDMAPSDGMRALRRYARVFLRNAPPSKTPPFNSGLSYGKDDFVADIDYTHGEWDEGRITPDEAMESAILACYHFIFANPPERESDPPRPGDPVLPT